MDRETTAPAASARQCDRAAVGSNQITRDREAKAQTLGEAALLDAAVERLEYPLALLRDNAGSGVGYRDPDLALARAGSGHDTAACRCVLDRVTQQVADCLSQTIGINRHQGQIRGNAGLPFQPLGKRRGTPGG